VLLVLKRGGHEAAPPRVRLLDSLTYAHISRMVFHMKTTLNIDDTVMQRLREEAARQGRTMSEMVEAGLRRVLSESPRTAEALPELPRWRSGGARVDIADRDALLEAMEER
jgi:plasmid stability protein